VSQTEHLVPSATPILINLASNSDNADIEMLSMFCILVSIVIPEANAGQNHISIHALNVLHSLNYELVAIIGLYSTIGRELRSPPANQCDVYLGDILPRFNNICAAHVIETYPSSY
jgi:hypothetical protein